MTKDRFQRIAGEAGLDRVLRGAVVAIGNFDGVHRGHQAVLGAALAKARELRAPALVLTFEPHPRSVFQPDRPVPRLTPAPMKARLLKLLGFDGVVERPFDRDFASLSAERFVEEVLLGQMDAAHVVVGHDFQFGAKRSGNADYLVKAGAAKDFGVTVVDAFHAAGEPVSSSRARALLNEGAAEAAAELLGYRWTVAGTVEHGRKVGRTLGYPTANMVLPFPDLLAHGIYAVRLRRADGTLHDGVASYGRRPTFDHGAPLFETFLFDFAGDLYGEEVGVSLFSRIRGEEHFDGVEALIERMNEDAREARATLAKAAALSPLDEALAF